MACLLALGAEKGDDHDGPCLLLGVACLPQWSGHPRRRMERAGKPEASLPAAQTTILGDRGRLGGPGSRAKDNSQRAIPARWAVSWQHLVAQVAASG